MGDGKKNNDLRRYVPAITIALVLLLGILGVAVLSLRSMPTWESRLTMLNLVRQFDGDLNEQFIEKVQDEYLRAPSDEQKVDILIWVVLHHDQHAAHESEEAFEMPLNSKLRGRFLQRVKALLASPESNRLSEYQHRTLAWFVEHENDLDKYAEEPQR